MNIESHRRKIQGASATVAVVEAVVAATGRRPETLEPLYDQIDGEALDTLLARGDDVRVRFEYAGFDVVVTPTEVRLTERA